MFQKVQKENPSPSQTLIQPKLEIGKEGDAHEKEAEHVADKVMRMPDSEEKKKMPESKPVLQKMKESPALMKMAESPAKPKMLESAVKIQKQAVNSSAGIAAPEQVEQGINNSKGNGQSLAPDLQQEMGSKMNADFSDVKIHTDATAAQMNKDVNAKAFTHGNDIYFNSGQYNPASSQGKHLLAHELTHTVQQNGDVNKMIRRFVPKDAAEEMIGRQFVLNAEVKAAAVTLPENSIVTVTKWNNKDANVTVSAIINKKNYTLSLGKKYLNPVKDTKSGLIQYHSNLSTTLSAYQRKEEEIRNQEQIIADWELQKKRYTTPAGLAEWQRQKNTHTDKLKDLKYELTGEGYAIVPKRLEKNFPLINTLNDNLIQQEMFNAFDANIVKWINYYQKDIGSKNKWSKPDANLIKSMMFQESKMGTSGPFLLKTRYEGDPMTRFNVMQGVDSSGSILTLIMNEMDSVLASKHKINDVTKDLYQAQKRYTELKKIKTLKPSEDLELKEINRRAPDGPNSKLWDNYYWTDSRFYDAWKEFNKQPGKERAKDYDFWIRSGIRWVFEKRKSENSWEEAIRAYNGKGDKAYEYKGDVVGRKNAAIASKGNFIPKADY